MLGRAQGEVFCQGPQDSFGLGWAVYLLEANVHVKGDGFPGVADRGNRILHIHGSCTGDQLHSERAGVVAYLKKT